MGQAQIKCSRAGCTSSAFYKLLWQNPKLHTGDRYKTWLACADHREFLINYLESRGFYRSEEVI
jgi:hypothetical protein